MTIWIEHRNPSGFDKGRKKIVNLDREPCPSIQAGGIMGDNGSHYTVIDDCRERERERERERMATKPPYAIPGMPQIEAIPWNGLRVASTFSGCGGSCLGYRMAGYHVVWANDCDPAAQASYRLNHPGTHLDIRDIRQVKPEDILAASGLKPGELDLFDGSPPCTSFSTAGKREKLWGKSTDHAGMRQTMDDLFFEYSRILRGLKPRAFVAENVSGLVKGTAKGYFKIILRELKACGYRVEARVLDAQWLGVPQMRQRVIFVGVREDLGMDPVFPKPMPYRYSVRDAIGDLIQGIEGSVGFNRHATEPLPVPSHGIMAGRPVSGYFANDEVRFIQDESGERSAGDVTELPAPTGRSARAGTMFVEFDQQIGNSSYRTTYRSLDVPHPTIMKNGPCSGSGELRSSRSMIRRKFTIAEVKRICSFPDDFRLAGSYAQQWARMGNSVPPLMMKAVAEGIRDAVLLPYRTAALQTSTADVPETTA